MSDLSEYKEYYNNETSLWFGKYKDVPLKDVPENYLKWLQTSEMWSKLSKSLKRAVGKHINKDV